MDYSPIYMSLIEKLVYLIPLIITIAFFKSPWFKGWLGELMISWLTKLRLDSDNYHLFNNITLPTSDGSTQIDHVIVSPFGVFVIETKNMKGWIFGSVNQKVWTQQIYKSKYKFQNPWHQNFKHKKALQELLGLEDKQMHSVVVFVGDSTFKTSMPENIINIGGYIRFIKSKTNVVLSGQQISEIVERIESGRLEPSFKTHRQHVKHVKEIKSEKKPQQKVAAKGKACKKCGRTMVLRTAKKGANAGNQFWGCSSFPKCRNVENI